MQTPFLSHDLHKEFPDLANRIARLKAGDHHFARRFDDYNALDREIVKAEEGIVLVGDVRLEDMKKKRLKLKDEIYQMLKAGA